MTSRDILVGMFVSFGLPKHAHEDVGMPPSHQIPEMSPPNLY
jgi:hypothetical protein